MQPDNNQLCIVNSISYFWLIHFMKVVFKYLAPLPSLISLYEFLTFNRQI